MTRRRIKAQARRARPGVTLVTHNAPASPFSLERFKDGTHGHKLTWMPGMTPARMHRYIAQAVAASKFAQAEIERLEREQRIARAQAADTEKALTQMAGELAGRLKGRADE